MQVPKVVLLIFVSGKVVLTGAKRVEGNSSQLLLLSLVAIVTHSCSCAFVVDLFPDVLKLLKLYTPSCTSTANKPVAAPAGRRQ